MTVKKEAIQPNIKTGIKEAPIVCSTTSIWVKEQPYDQRETDCERKTNYERTANC